MAKKISPFLLRSEYVRYIEEHQFLPDAMKPELKRLVASHFGLLASTIGLVELTYRRTLAAAGTPTDTGEEI